MSIDSKIAEIMEESKLAGLVLENEEIVEEEVSEEVTVEESIKVDVSTDVDALMFGESLSEEFREKAATIFK